MHAATSEAKAKFNATIHYDEPRGRPRKINEENEETSGTPACTRASVVSVKPQCLVQVGLINAFRKCVAKSKLEGDHEIWDGSADTGDPHPGRLQCEIQAEMGCKLGIVVKETLDDGTGAQQQQRQGSDEFTCGQGGRSVSAYPESNPAAPSQYIPINLRAPTTATAIETAAAPIAAPTSRDVGIGATLAIKVLSKDGDNLNAFSLLMGKKPEADVGNDTVKDESIPADMLKHQPTWHNAFSVLMNSEQWAQGEGCEMIDTEVPNNEVPRKEKSRPTRKSTRQVGLAEAKVDQGENLIRETKLWQMAPCQEEAASRKSNAALLGLRKGGDASTSDQGQDDKEMITLAQVGTCFSEQVSRRSKPPKSRDFHRKKQDETDSWVEESPASQTKQEDFLPVAESTAENVDASKAVVTTIERMANMPQCCATESGDPALDSADPNARQPSKAEMNALSTVCKTHTVSQERNPVGTSTDLLQSTTSNSLVARIGKFELVQALPATREETPAHSSGRPQFCATVDAHKKARRTCGKSQECVMTENATNEAARVRMKRRAQEDAIYVAADFFLTPAEKKARKELRQLAKQHKVQEVTQEERRLRAEQDHLRKKDRGGRAAARWSEAKRNRAEERELWHAQQEQTREDLATINSSREIAEIFCAPGVRGEYTGAINGKDVKSDYGELRARDVDDELPSFGPRVGLADVLVPIPCWFEEWPWSVPSVAIHQPLPLMCDTSSSAVRLGNELRERSLRDMPPRTIENHPRGSLPLHMDLGTTIKGSFLPAKLSSVEQVSSKEQTQADTSMGTCATETELAERMRWHELLERRFIGSRCQTSRLESEGGNLECEHEWETQLWSELLQPHCRAELCGNASAAGKLRCWLLRRAERQMKKTRSVEAESNLCHSDDSSWDSEYKESDHLAEASNLIVLEGPSGAGKTAAVYACARELGFKVIEVHAGMHRAGKHLLSQFAEATQSHELGKWSSASLGGGATGEHRFLKVRQKQCAMKRSVGVAKELEFFTDAGKEIKAARFHSHRSAPTPAVASPASKLLMPVQQAAPVTTWGVEAIERTLILFEAAEHVFEEDAGFYAALRRLVKMSKCPIVVTVNKWPRELQVVPLSLQWRRPNLSELLPYMEALCEARGLMVSSHQLQLLLRCMSCDMRKVLNALQSWAVDAAQIGKGGRSDRRNTNLEAMLGFATSGALSLTHLLPPPSTCTAASHKDGVVPSRAHLLAPVWLPCPPTAMYLSVQLHLHSSAFNLLQQQHQRVPLLDHALQLLDGTCGGLLLGDTHLKAQLMRRVDTASAETMGLKDTARAIAITMEEDEEGRLRKRRFCSGTPGTTCPDLRKGRRVQLVNAKNGDAMSAVSPFVGAALPGSPLQRGIVSGGVRTTLHAATSTCTVPSIAKVAFAEPEKTASLSTVATATEWPRGSLQEADFGAMDSTAEFYEMLSSVPLLLHAAYPAEPSGCWADMVCSPLCTSLDLASTQQLLGLCHAAAILRSEACSQCSSKDDTHNHVSLSGGERSSQGDGSELESGARSQAKTFQPHPLLLLPDDISVASAHAQKHCTSLGRPLEHLLSCAPSLSCGIGRHGSRDAQVDYQATLRSICTIEASRKVPQKVMLTCCDRFAAGLFFCEICDPKRVQLRLRKPRLFHLCSFAGGKQYSAIRSLS